MNTSSGHSSMSTSSLLEANDIVWELVKKPISAQQNIIVYQAETNARSSVLAIFGGKRQLPPIMLMKIKFPAAIFCRRRIFVSLMMLHCLLNSINSSKYEHMIRK